MRDEMRRHLGRIVMVQLDGEDESIGGRLIRVGPLTLTLSEATFISSTAEPTSADGEVVVSRHSVLWTQVAVDA